MGKTAIKLEDFTYYYKDAEEPALKNVTFEIQQGELIGVIGCNKSGKSTLCIAMAGVVPYSLGGKWDGTVAVMGEDLEESAGGSAPQHVGIVFQDAESQFTQETVEDEMAFAMCNQGIEQQEMHRRVEEVSKKCHLYDMLDRSPLRLSGGQQQRLAVAGILSLNPEIIILDESTSQLDPIGRDEVFSLVSDLHKEGKTVIMVDHNVEKLAEYVDKILVLDKGEVVLFDETRKVFAQRDKLEKYKIRVPQVTAAALALQKKYPFEQVPINLTEAIDQFEKGGL